MTSNARVTSNLLCFSHLRWDFVYQRPQHLMTRAAKHARVIFWEEPVYTATLIPLAMKNSAREGVLIVQPQLPWGTSANEAVEMQRDLLDALIRDWAITDPLLWYYTPLALAFSDHLVGQPVVYDCMDELAAFEGADPTLPEWERALLRRATLVFTGGMSLFEAKRTEHQAVYAFPSGVDVEHFRPARFGLPEPPDQAAVPARRIGFFGVLDERLDRALLARAAALRPAWQFILVGPLAKLDEADLPNAGNIHYLGPKSYDELPAYIGGWDVAMMPFARNAATRFISPTKMPEYLAAGRPVVSTPIADVARRWGDVDYVRIANDAEGFVAAADALYRLASGWQVAADVRLAAMAWDRIWAEMDALIRERRFHPAHPARLEAATFEAATLEAAGE